MLGIFEWYVPAWKECGEGQFRERNEVCASFSRFGQHHTQSLHHLRACIGLLDRPHLGGCNRQLAGHQTGTPTSSGAVPTISS